MFVQALDIPQALKFLQQGDWRILAGGTDFYPSLQDRLPINSSQGKILDISAIPDLNKIHETPDYWRFGALTRWRDVQDASLPSRLRCLQQVAREVGSLQIQNRATMVGNLCTASPAGDGIPALLALRSEVEIVSFARKRQIKLADFITGYRSTALELGEMVSAILVPNLRQEGVSQFRKLGSRKYLVISIAMVVVHLVLDADNKIIDATIAVGACSAVAQQIPMLAQELIGKKRDKKLGDNVVSHQFEHLTPIDDVRATSDYRKQIVPELVRRTLLDCVG